MKFYTFVTKMFSDHEEKLLIYFW